MKTEQVCLRCPRWGGFIHDPKQVACGVTFNAAFDEVVQRVTAVFKEEGFGILTDIDVQATLKAKLDADMPS